MNFKKWRSTTGEGNMSFEDMSFEEWRSTTGGVDCRLATKLLQEMVLRIAFEAGQNLELISAAQALVDWLNDTGKTNKSRRSRVPEKLLSNLENQL